MRLPLCTLPKHACSKHLSHHLEIIKQQVWRETQGSEYLTSTYIPKPWRSGYSKEANLRNSTWYSSSWTPSHLFLRSLVWCGCWLCCLSLAPVCCLEFAQFLYQFCCFSASSVYLEIDIAASVLWRCGYSFIPSRDFWLCVPLWSLSPGRSSACQFPICSSLGWRWIWKGDWN